MGNIEDRGRRPVQKGFQPLQRFQIQIVGRFVEQQQIASVQKQGKDLQFDPFSAGERVHGPVLPDQIFSDPQLIQYSGYRFRVFASDPACVFQIAVYRKLSVFTVQLLAQIACYVIAADHSANLRVFFYGRVFCDPAQDRGLAVSLFADHRRFFPVVEDEGQILNEDPVILFLYDRQILYLQHSTSKSRKAVLPTENGSTSNNAQEAVPI